MYEYSTGIDSKLYRVNHYPDNQFNLDMFIQQCYFSNFFKDNYLFNFATNAVITYMSYFCVSSEWII